MLLVPHRSQKMSQNLLKLTSSSHTPELLGPAPDPFSQRPNAFVGITAVTGKFSDIPTKFCIARQRNLFQETISALYLGLVFYSR